MCDGQNRIYSSILSDGGRLSIAMENLNNFCSFPLNCFPKTCPVTSLDPNLIRFSKSFQNALSKAHPLELELKEFTKEEQEKKIGWFDENALTEMAKKQANKVKDSINSVGNDEANRNEYSPFEVEFLPVLKSERLVNRFKAGQFDVPCCECTEGCYLCPSSCSCCAACCTCGIRPFRSGNSSMVTTHAIYHFSHNRTYPWCCVACWVPPNNGGFTSAWAPIRSLQGQTFSFQASGVLPSKEKGIFGGKYAKSPGPSNFFFTILLENEMEFRYNGGIPDRNWLVDDELKYEQYVMSELQLKLIDLESGNNAPGIQAMERLPGEEGADEGEEGGCIIA